MEACAFGHVFPFNAVIDSHLWWQGVEGIEAYGIDKLIQVAASQLSDQLPESREAARTLLLELQNVYEKSHDLTPTVSEESEPGSWENFCQSKLSPLSAQAVLRVTNIAREGLVLSSWRIAVLCTHEFSEYCLYHPRVYVLCWAVYYKCRRDISLIFFWSFLRVHFYIHVNTMELWDSGLWLNR